MTDDSYGFATRENFSHLEKIEDVSQSLIDEATTLAGQSELDLPKNMAVNWLVEAFIARQIDFKTFVQQLYAPERAVNDR